MAKNSREGNQTRNKRYREALAERGIRPVQVLAPESAHPLIRQAAGLMIRAGDPMEPRTALRQAGGANEPGPGEASPELTAELEAARARITEIEREAAARRAEVETAEARGQALQAERDSARAAEAEALEKAKAAGRTAYEAEQQAVEAKREARRAWAPIRRLKTMPGFRGRLARWIADVRPDPDD